jgi:hypothetical protein
MGLGLTEPNAETASNARKPLIERRTRALTTEGTEEHGEIADSVRVQSAAELEIYDEIYLLSRIRRESGEQAC